MVDSAGVVLQAGSPAMLVGLLVLVVAVVAVWHSVVVVDAYEKRALTVLGEYRGLLEPGINLVPPFVSKTHSLDMRTQRLSVSHGEGSAWDTTVTADVRVTVTDAEMAYRSSGDHVQVVTKLAKATVQQVLEGVDLDDALEAPEELNAAIRDRLDEQTGEFGVRVESVEVRRADAPAGRATPAGGGREGA